MVILNSHGKEMTSKDFADFTFQCLEDSCSNMVFVLGGCTEISMELVGASIQLCSLSQMKVKHLSAQAFLAEHLYRATEFRKYDSCPNGHWCSKKKIMLDIIFDPSHPFNTPATVSAHLRFLAAVSHLRRSFGV